MDKNFKDELGFHPDLERLFEHARLKTMSKERGIPYVFHPPSKITEDLIQDKRAFVAFLFDPESIENNKAIDQDFLSTAGPLMNYPSEPQLTRKQRRRELYTKNKKWYHRFSK